MKVALVGLMQSGKSTLLSGISGKGVRAGSGGVVEEVVGVTDESLYMRRSIVSICPAWPSAMSIHGRRRGGSSSRCERLICL